MCSQDVYIVVESNAETTGIGVVGAFSDNETAEAAAELQRNPETHGQQVVVRQKSVQSEPVSPHPDCGNADEAMCEGDSSERIIACRWGDEELDLCGSCIDYFAAEIEVIGS